MGQEMERISRGRRTKDTHYMQTPGQKNSRNSVDEAGGLFDMHRLL